MATRQALRSRVPSLEDRSSGLATLACHGWCSSFLERALWALILEDVILRAVNGDLLCDHIREGSPGSFVVRARKIELPANEASLSEEGSLVVTAGHISGRASQNL
jgi:hypothetical protein